MAACNEHWFSCGNVGDHYVCKRIFLPDTTKFYWASCPVGFFEDPVTGECILPPDLVANFNVTNVTTDFAVGGLINIDSGSIENISNGPMEDPTLAGYFISSDAQFDASDQLILSYNIPPIAANGIVDTGATVLTVPNLPAGDYNLLLVANYTLAPSEINTGNNASAWAFTIPSVISQLELTSEKNLIYPQGTGVSSNYETKLIAKLDFSIPVTSSYQVDFEVSEFDHDVSGHTHTIIPLPGPSKGNLLSTSCSIQVVNSSTGTCEVNFISSDLSGMPTLQATVVDGAATLVQTTDIDIRYPGLVSFSSSWFAPLRSPDTDHTNAVAFYIDSSIKDEIEEFIQNYQEMTLGRIEPAPTIVLMLNDMSLPWGGRFDVFANWVSPHDSHRTGTSVDINRKLKNLTVPAGDPNEFVDLSDSTDRRSVALACNNTRGARFIVTDPNWHCEF